MPELVVISGKGGTGKTSVLASFAALARPVVLVDCDVDASDLHLVLNPVIQEKHRFLGGNKARIEPRICAGCGNCREACRFDAVLVVDGRDGAANKAYVADPLACEGCGVCARFCPNQAIELLPATSGDWFISQTVYGPMVHARLDPGAGNSGKLISLLRQQARELSANGDGLILCDGSPGIGCPVVASLTGADLALLVVEPTCSSLHDLERVAQLCRHFHMKAMLVLNKWNLNPSLTNQVESQAARWGLPILGRLCYDPAVTEAQIQRKPVVEHDPGSGVADDLRRLWAQVSARLSTIAAATPGAAPQAWRAGVKTDLPEGRSRKWPPYDHENRQG